MKLAAWIEKLPAPALEHFRQLLQLNKEPCQQYAALCRELQDRLTSQMELDQTMQRLKPWIQEVLKIAVRQFGTRPYAPHSLEQAALEEGISGSQVHAAITALKRHGILMGIRKSWGDEMLLLPDETLNVWHQLLFPGGLLELEPSVLWDGEPVGNTGCAAYDMLEVMKLVSEEGIRMTRQGTWPKPALRKLESLLSVRDEDLRSAGLIIKPEGTYEPAAALVLDLSIRSGLLYMSEDRWLRKEEVFQYWLDKPLAAVQKELYKLWRESTAGPEPWESHAFRCLEQAETNRWYLLDQLFEWLRDCGMIKRIAASMLSDFVQSRLLPMQALGWIRILRINGGGFAFQVQFPLSDSFPEPSAAYNGLIIQTDMELVLQPSPPLKLLWQVMAWSQPVSRGEMSVFRITKDRIQHAAADGHSAEAIIDALSRYCCTPMDQHVKCTLQEWTGGFKAVLLKGITLLKLEDPNMCRYVEELEDLRGLLVERVGEGVYIIPAHACEEVSRILQTLDIVTIRSAGNPAEMSVRSDCLGDSSCPALLLIPSVQEPVCTPAPFANEAAADYTSIPAVWWKSLSNYHSSTRKDVIRKAIEWKTPVRLAAGGGDDWELIPLSIREGGDQWVVEGLRDKARVMVHSDEWNRIKIIIPGVSD